MLVVFEGRDDADKKESAKSACALALACKYNGLFHEESGEEKQHLFVGENREEYATGEPCDGVFRRKSFAGKGAEVIILIEA